MKMQYKKIAINKFVVRLEKEEEIIKTLKSFCMKKRISGGEISGIGAVSKVTLAHFNPKKNKYNEKKYHQPLEMVFIGGNIAMAGKDLIIHLHTVLSDEKMNAIGGHLKEGTISATAEIFIKSEAKLIKKMDKKTRLNLLNLK